MGMPMKVFQCLYFRQVKETMMVLTVLEEMVRMMRMEIRMQEIRMMRMEIIVPMRKKMEIPVKLKVELILGNQLLRIE